MKYCTKCGQPVKDSDDFCANCGNKIQVTAPNVPSIASETTASSEPERIVPHTVNKDANTAFAFNLIATVGNFICMIFLEKTFDISPIRESGSVYRIGWYLWIISFILLFAIGCIITFIRPKESISRILSFAYLVLSITATIFLFVMIKDLIAWILFLLGLIFLIPSLFELLAAIKYVQATA